MAFCIRILVLGVSMAALACEAGPGGIPVVDSGGNGEGRILIGLSSDGSEVGALIPEMAAFRVRMYEKPPASLDKKAYFTSGCVRYNTFFQLSNLPVGSHWVIALDGFSTADVDGTPENEGCVAGTEVAFGIRGEVTIAKVAEEGDTQYHYIQVNRRGALTSFPLPDAHLNPPQGGISCTTDDICRTELHPAATCDSTTSGICRVESFFPLNERTRRAFHTAIMADDLVAMLGGYNTATATQMQVKAPTAETFASSSSLFGETALALQDEHGFAAATAYDESRVVLFGGASTVAIEKAGGLLLPDFLPQTCTGPDKCTMTLSNFVNVVSPVSGSFVPSTLPYSGAGGVAAVVRAPDGSRRILVRPGFVQKPPARVELGTAAWLCALDDADAVTCETVAGTDVARGLSTGVCLAEEGGVCRDYMILGGGASGAKGDAFAEIYLAADGTLRKVGGGTGLPTALAGAVAVRLAGTVFTFGGVTDGEAAAGPLRIDVDASTNKVSASAVGSLGADVGETLRLFHQATPLADGSSVLLTGGIGKDKKPLDTAILLTAANGTLTVKAKLKLAKTDGTPDPRVGHAATLVTSGLLKGAILVTGGLSQMDTTVRFAAGAQIFVP